MYPHNADDKVMNCSVVIPCHNGDELTRACILSLLGQSAPPAEILIVDNASTDATAELGSIDASVRVIGLPDNLGFAGGVNAGLAAAAGDTVLVLNNDTLAADNLLSELHDVLQSDARIGACAPVSNHVKGDALLHVGDFGRDPDQRRELSDSLRASEPRLQDADTLAGLCLLMRRSTLAEIGSFDTRFGHGNYEDDDFCLRLRLRGYRLAIARRAFLHHEGHATFRALGLDLKTEIQKRLAQFRDKWLPYSAGLATIAAIHNNHALAAQAAAEAQRQFPQWIDADLHIGRHQERAGDAAAAIRHLRAFLRRCPEHVEARLTLGLALVRDGQSSAGHRVVEETVKVHRPTPAQEEHLLRRLGQLTYEGGQFLAAASHFRTALATKPDSGELHNWLGLCELANEDVAAAAASFTAACDHGFAMGHTNLGVCQSRLGDLDSAMQSFEKAVELLPNDPIARANYQAGAAACAAAAR